MPVEAERRDAGPPLPRCPAEGCRHLPAVPVFGREVVPAALEASCARRSSSLLHGLPPRPAGLPLPSL